MLRPADVLKPLLQHSEYTACEDDLREKVHIPITESVAATYTVSGTVATGPKSLSPSKQ